MTNKNNSVLYTGVTSYLERRDWQHQEKIYQNSFTARYNIKKLVYYETFGEAYLAINREKQIKNLLRSKKISLINSFNPEWKDLSLDF